MTRNVLSMALLTTAALAPPLSAHAAGTLTRTFVSSAGLDSNPCTVTAPCRTFAAAYAATATNGIIAALDAGHYGPVTITGPVTIDGNGFASITAPASGNGISINAGASDKVILRGLNVDGGGNLTTPGIAFNSGASLVMEGCVIGNMAGDGFDFVPAAAATLAVSNSYFIDNAGNGLFINGGGAVAASIDRTLFTGNAVGGFHVRGTSAPATAAVTDSVAANNNGPGFAAETITPTNTPTVNLSLTRVQAVGNGSGVFGSGINVTIWLAQSTVTGNALGFATGVGVINSYGDNYFADNNGNAGSLTPVSKQ